MILNLILILGFVSLLFFYGRRNRFPFFLFRLLGTLFALILIANFNFRLNLIKRPKDLLILLDVSESMKENLSLTEKVISFFSQKKEIKIFPFAETIGVAREKLSGKRTEMGRALEFALSKKPGAIVLISDGLDNGREDPIKIAEKSETPIYTIATGKEKGRDLAISECLYPEIINEGESLRVKVLIRATNLPGERELFLIKDDKVLERKKIILEEGEYYREEEFSVLPEKGGYSVFIESVPNEDDYANNHFPLTFAMREKKKRIYYVTNSLTYNLKFIREILSEDRDTELNIIFSLDGRTFYHLLGEERKVISELDLPKNAILILDNIRFHLLPPNFKNPIRDLSLNCLGVLFLCGEEDYREMENWLPFSSEGKVVKKEIEWGIVKEMMGSSLFSHEGENLLINAPPFLGMIKSKVKPNAHIWWESDEGPLLGYWRYRDKKIIQLTGFPFWRLFFFPDENWEKRREFLRNLFDFFLFGEKVFSLRTDKKRYFSGEEIRVRVYAFDETGRPLANLDLELIADEVRIPMVAMDKGLYTAKLFLPPGEHLLRVIGRENGEERGEAEGEVIVEEKSVEFLRRGIDKEVLSSIAQRSNGEFFFADSIIARGEMPTFRWAEYKRELKFIPRRSLPIYLLIAGIFIGEWIFRKKKGLP